MIAINITRTGLTVDGHAGYAKTGNDIICAAVSALTQGLDLIEQYYENTTVDTLAELEEEGRDKFEELKNYKQLKISVDDTDLELGDIVGGRERITNIYMAAPVIRKIVDVTGRGRMSILYKLKGEE